MIYKNFQNIKLSALGMGGMRFPTVNGEYGNVDEAELGKLIDYAIAHGINYFDTAWGYHEGNSETVLGRALGKYPRESYYLATKFPGYDLSNMGKVEEIFEKQLEKCGVDYFDFYLFHNVCEKNIDMYLDPKFGIYDYLMKQKKNGRIRHLGFSTHGTIETIKRFLDAYGAGMEFCQIQLNWLDWKLQGAREKVGLLRSRGLPIWVMEPVRGGRLAKIDGEYENELKVLRPGATVPEWAFRFLQSIDDVVVTLSGMGTLEQLCENIATFSEEKPLSGNEMQTLVGISDKMMSAKNTLPCTACRYCTSHCPIELDIPQIIQLYNDYTYSGAERFSSSALRSLGENKQPADCIGCRSCEAVCPQNIKISEMMKIFTSKLDEK